MTEKDPSRTTCQIFDGLDGAECTNEANEHGICDRHAETMEGSE